MLKPVRDHLQHDLDLIFIGFNPSIMSSETGHHFANPNNRFWKILHEAGLTPRKYKPEEDGSLLELGYGMTNIVARPTKAADEITKEEYEQGRLELLGKIQKYKPKFACYVGKGVYQQLTKNKRIPWGVQQTSAVSGTIDFVAPSSSGLVRMKVDDIVAIYRELTELLMKIRNEK